MIPILLLSKNLAQTKKYIDSFIKKNALAPSSVFVYHPNPNVITIEQIREINSYFARAVSQLRLFVIYDFDSAKKETQNAFLKTLEEKSQSTQFILTLRDLGYIVSTIISRCKVIKLKVSSEKAKIEKTQLHAITTQSLATLFASYIVTDREKAVKLLDRFLLFVRDAIQKPHAVSAIREILKTRNLLVKNNLSPQIACDHVVIFLKQNLSLTK